MAKTTSVTLCILDAVRFVFNNFLDCIFYVLPILFLVSVLAWIQSMLGGGFALVQSLLEPFLYAMFAVAWHRYSVLESERARRGFPYRFGKRELKFGAASVLFALLMSSLAQLLGGFLPQEVALIALPILLTPILATVVFIYPAIALDQPLRIRLFLNEGVKLILSFIVAIIAVVTVIGLLTAAAYFGLQILATIFTPPALKVLIFVLYNLVIIPLVLAITTSSASFLYKTVIGLEEENEQDAAG